MQVKVRIDRKNIHHRTDGEKKYACLDVHFTDYPNLPTYGIQVEFPITKQKVIDAITAKAVEASAQMQKDTELQNLLGIEILDFEVTI